MHLWQYSLNYSEDHGCPDVLDIIIQPANASFEEIRVSLLVSGDLDAC